MIFVRLQIVNLNWKTIQFVQGPPLLMPIHHGITPLLSTGSVSESVSLVINQDTTIYIATNEFCTVEDSINILFKMREQILV